MVPRQMARISDRRRVQRVLLTRTERPQPGLVALHGQRVDHRHHVAAAEPEPGAAADPMTSRGERDRTVGGCPVDAAVHDQRLGDRHPHRRGRLHRHGHRARGRRVAVGQAVTTVLPHPDQHQRRNEQGDELQPELHGLRERDRPHATHDDRGDHHAAHDQAADPAGRTGLRPQGERRALQLRHQVQPTDEHDERAGQPAHHGASRAGSRRSPAACTRRCAAAGRPPERAAPDSPRCSRPGTRGRRSRRRGRDPAMPEVGRGRQVLPADRGGVPARRHRARRDVEVAGRAGPAQAERAGHRVATATSDHRHHDRGAVAHRRRTSSMKSRSVRSALRTVYQPQRDQDRVDEHAEHEPRHGHADDVERGEDARHGTEQRGADQHARRWPRTRSRASRRWLRISDVMYTSPSRVCSSISRRPGRCGARRTASVRGCVIRTRAGSAVVVSSLGANRSRSSRVCRRLTGNSTSPTRTAVPPVDRADLVDVRQRDQRAAVDADEAGGRPSGPRASASVSAAGGSRRPCAGGRSHPAPRRTGPGSAARSG